MSVEVVRQLSSDFFGATVFCGAADSAESPVSVLVTNASTGAKLFQIQSDDLDESSSAVVQSVELSSGSASLTCRAVLHPKTSKVVCASDKQLIAWKTQAKSSQAQQRTFPNTIQDVHVAPLLDETVLVFNDGAVQLVSNQLETVSSSQAKQQSSGSVLQSRLCWSPTLKFAMLVTARPIADGVHLDLHAVRPRDASVKNSHGSVTFLRSHAFSPQQSSSSLVSFDLDLAARTLAILWSDAQCQVVQFAEHGNPARAFAANADTRFQRAISNQPKCVSFVGPVLAICGTTIQCWEPVYGTLQAEHQLPATVDWCCPCGDNGVLVQTSKSSLSVVSLGNSAAQVGLRAALGKAATRNNNANTDNNQNDHNIALSSIVSARSCLESDDWSQHAQSSSSHEEHVIAKLTQTQSTTDKKQKKALSARAFHKLFTEFVESAGSSEPPSKKRKISKSQTTRVLSHNFVSLVAPVCVRDSHWDELSVLIGTDSLSCKVVPQLIQHLIRHKQYDLLSQTLSSVHDIPESHVCTVVQHVLDEPQNATNDALLVQCVAVPINTVFLCQALTHLSPKQVHTLLQRCLQWLQTHRQRSLQNRAKSGPLTPKFGAVLRWLTVLLDAHLSDLVLDSACHDSLRGIGATIAEFCAQSGQLAQLKACLDSFLAQSSKRKQSQIARAPRNAQLYQIERIDL